MQEFKPEEEMFNEEIYNEEVFRPEEEAHMEEHGLRPEEHAHKQEEEVVLTAQPEKSGYKFNVSGFSGSEFATY